MIKVAIVGYGNIGKGVLQGVLQAKDMLLCGVITRNVKEKKGLLELRDIPVVQTADALSQKPDVAILCVPSRHVTSVAEQYLKQGICTVDSFDIHTEILPLRGRLKKVAEENNVSAVVAAGWDPGSDSIVRALLQALAPKGITYTNFGSGMSMGHSVAARQVPGVEDALSITVPKGEGLHKRMVYVKLEEGANFQQVEEGIKVDPYFQNDETHVKQVEDVEQLKDTGHGVQIERKGSGGGSANQRFSFSMEIDNPALTGSMLTACARACVRMPKGAFTTIELPPAFLLEGELEEWIASLV